MKNNDTKHINLNIKNIKNEHMPISYNYTQNQTLVALYRMISEITTPQNMKPDKIETKLELCIKKYIRRKISSYRKQDEKMNRVIDENITEQQLIKLLHESSLKCFYCKTDITFFAPPRSPNIWTLDRKENHISHTSHNVVVSCLNCNLKKRRQDTNKFLFSKQLSSVKKIN